MIDSFVKENDYAVAFTSIGINRYLSALRYCVIGNSSSGFVEAPSFCIPTINIGDRQKRLLQAESVINCEPIKEDMGQAIALALTEEFMSKAGKTVNPYMVMETHQGK
ncbi:UDP-N-acetylglucosamine 2-epimerase [Virgibacillus byunsanensis]|uniref:UDP-N-acetylglucosamine 2-epimerase n=1 Tax=Virgibacillus byunsanensis TaxID=570945 RepID=A0ABW3LIR0_9BACI